MLNQIFVEFGVQHDILIRHAFLVHFSRNPFGLSSRRTLCLNLDTDFTRHNQPSGRSLQKFHTDRLAVLSVTHNHSAGLFDRVRRGFVTQDDEKNIRIGPVAYLLRVTPSNTSRLYSSNKLSQFFCSPPHRQMELAINLFHVSLERQSRLDLQARLELDS